jgi:Abnormal spindle-like microcephaly-assoc'd, ASPM-SPD-2-Hydin
VSGTGFRASGVAVPATIPAGQSVALQVTYAPTAAGASSGSVAITSDAQTPTSTVSLSGTGMNATYSMSLTPGSVSFGNCNVGSSSTQTVQLANTGNSSVTVSQLAASGAGVSVNGLTAPVTIAPAQSVPLTVKFSPTAGGAVAGSVTVTNSEGINAVAAVTGNAVQAGLSVTPSSASFGSVVTGNTNSQTIQLKNSGTASLTVSQVTATGSGFSVSGAGVPFTLAPGAASTFNVQYAPTSAGAANGSVTIVSDAPNSPAAVSLSGTGVAATYTLSVSPGSLSFGSVTDGSSSSQSFSVTNTGNSNVSISGVSATGSGFSIASGGGALTLSPNQSTSVSVQFAPTAAGSANGTVSVASNATGSASVTLSGTGVAPQVNHTVALNWGASSSSVAGYNVYRSSVSGSSYAKVNSSPIGGVSYTDSSVQSGQTYYYVATSVDANGIESVYSNEVPAIVP